MSVTVRPIGTMKSVFHFKNGTPRQSSLCDTAHGIITIEKSIFSNPEHSLIGLEEFSHAWVIFIFHKNKIHTKAKVKPPRLNGQRVGVFSSRSPYRPNNIGLSLVKIDKIEGPCVYVSGIDILDGTPIIDIKPYIPEYDKPKELMQGQCESASPHCLLSANTTSALCMNNKDNDSSLTEQNKDIENIFNVGHNSEEADTHFETSTALSSDSNNENNTAVEKTQKYCDILMENSYKSSDNICVQSQVLESNTTNNASSFSNNEEIRENLVPISEGFCAISAALVKVGEKLCEVADQQKFDSLNRQQVKELVSHTSDIQLHHNLPAGLIYKGNENVDILLDGIVSKMAFERSHYNSSLDSSDGTLSSSLPTCEANRSHTAAASSSNTEMPKTVTKGIKLSSDSNNSCNDHMMHTAVASWLLNPPVSKLNVNFTSEALEQLQKFSKQSSDSMYQLQMFSSPEEAQKSISDILREEPRSVYRRQQCQDSLYYFAVDVLHVTCWFDEDTAHVVRVKPVACVPKLQS